MKVGAYSVQQPPELLWETTFSDFASHIKFTTEGKRLITACDDGKIQVFDAHSGSPQSASRSSRGAFPLRSISTGRGNRILSARTSQAARIWSLSPPAPLPVGVMNLGAPPLLLNLARTGQCVGENGQGLAFAPPAGDWPDLQASPFDFKAPLAAAIVLPSGAIAAGAADGRVLVLDNGQVREGRKAQRGGLATGLLRVGRAAGRRGGRRRTRSLALAGVVRDHAGLESHQSHRRPRAARTRLGPHLGVMGRLAGAHRLADLRGPRRNTGPIGSEPQVVAAGPGAEPWASSA